MDQAYLKDLFDMDGMVVVVTGGGGILCGALSRALGRLGAQVAVLDLIEDSASQVATEIQAAGGEAVSFQCDVLNRASVASAAQGIVEMYGRVDVLINGAGGNKKDATTSADLSFFDLPAEAIGWVFSLNILGSVLPSQVFGRLMAKQGDGTILNISSMSAYSPLTRVPAYSAAKAAVSNFTQWLAVHMAQEYSPRIRVNAIAPGFFLTEQNRFLLTEEDTGNLTPRGETIIDHTPMERFGDPEDLIGTTIWLLSPAAGFVTGIVVPVDGGFSAFGGV
jgi:NAD(P)-dependent dehydrogenase (short-subunit alcohol dehydrogenase family)